MSFGRWIVGSGYFFLVFGFDKGLQAFEVRTPEAAILVEPLIDSFQRLGIELIETVAAFPVLINQMSPAQDFEVLGDGWARNGKSAGNLPGRTRPCPQEIEHGAAGGIGQGVERAVP